MPLFTPKTDLSQFKGRYVVMIAFFVLAIIVLAGRLYSLQVTHGDEYTEKSRANIAPPDRQIALRGMVFDRTGELLVDNKPSFDVYFTPVYCTKEEFEIILARLTEYLGLTEEEIERTRELYFKSKGLDRFQSYLVRRNMAWAELAMVEQNLGLLAGVEVRPGTRREYPKAKLAAHLLGYVGEISASELRLLKDQGYRQGDYIGKAGVEKAWEAGLKGKNGMIRVVKDARGQRMPEAIARKMLKGDGVIDPAVAGANLYLSIDARLQALAETRFPGQEGAVVAVDPQTGFILAIVSKPAFDPNIVSGRVSPRLWKELIENVDDPLTNRATQQHFPPGSTFKAFTGLAALETEGFSAEGKEVCRGAMRFGSHLFRCWRGGGHGKVAMHRAVVQSCDVYFYRAGLKAGLDEIARVSRSFGFGRKTGFESCREVPGIMPDKAWYKKHTQWGFLPGFTLSDSIGQGDVNVTPLQLAMAYGALANGGVLYQPQVVQRIETPFGELIEEKQPIFRRRVEVSDENLRIMAEALTGVVNEPGGTAYYRRPRKVAFKAAGKTGTAQVVKQGDDRGRNLPYDFRDHAWFVGWAPVSDPQIVVAVVNEHGGHGSSGAAPLVMELITYYLEQLGGRGAPLESGTETPPNQPGPKEPPSSADQPSPKQPLSGNVQTSPKKPPSGSDQSKPKKPPNGSGQASPKETPSGDDHAGPKEPPSDADDTGPKEPRSDADDAGPRELLNGDDQAGPQDARDGEGQAGADGG